MASVLLRAGTSKMLCIGLNSGLCKNLPKKCHPAAIQVAFITGKALRVDRPPRPPPFDYVNKHYKAWDVFMDPMEERFDDNSKLVVVEGLPAVGKTKFCQQLADELEMHYMPPPCFDDMNIDYTGFDYRTLNSKLPVNAHFFDDLMFHENPSGINTCAIQSGFYILRMAKYIQALSHILSTGQGVILNRCAYSDIVFMKSMLACGYVTQNGMNYYKSSLEASLHHLLRPHLVIYLDIPPEVSMQRIKRRGLPHELKSKALTLKFLSELEANYKNLYLPEISTHAHALMYDWTEDANINFIVDDIEKLEFDTYDREHDKMWDWNFETLDQRRAKRDLYCNEAQELLIAAHIMRFDVPEMLIEPEEVQARRDVIYELNKKIPGTVWAPGFDPTHDQGILWKWVNEPYEVVQKKREENIKKRQLESGIKSS